MGSQSKLSKPVPSSLQNLATPSAQLVSPGVHTTQPSGRVSPLGVVTTLMQR